MKLLIGSFVAIAMLAVGSAQAAEITLVAPGGIRAALEQLLPVFEKQTGNKVTVTYLSGGKAKEAAIAGGVYDVPIVQPPLDTVLASGHVVAKSQTALANVWVGVAVRPGAKKPNISNAAAVKRMLLGAKSITYPSAANGAAAGVSFDQTMAKLGITDAMKPKIKIAPNGNEAMAMLARGEVEIGLTFISEMSPGNGIELVGPLPRAISTPTGLIAFVNAQSKEPKAAAALVKFLASPTAAKIYKKSGMSAGK